jgi:catechol 2,3-dioxygenase-like lactoylglutathione lyase family enzyme
MTSTQGQAIVAAIDHIMLVVPDLEAARDEFATLGFQIAPKAVHERFGTACYLIILKDMYIELLAIETPNPPDPSTHRRIAACLAAGGGLNQIALSTGDAVATQRTLVAFGHDVTEPIDWSRKANTPDGVFDAQFTTLLVNSELLPEFETFFCVQRTPQHVLHPVWQVHPNGCRNLVSLTRETARSVEETARQIDATGLAHEQSDEDVRVQLGSHVLRYVTGTSGDATTITLNATGRTGAVQLASLANTRLQFVIDQTTNGQGKP